MILVNNSSFFPPSLSYCSWMRPKGTETKSPKENKQEFKARLCDIRHGYKAVTADNNITSEAQISVLTKHLNIYSFSQIDFTA